ncbi:MAG: anthranilate phosphoribosyltransferase [Deltaproteobacteria bacterium]
MLKAFIAKVVERVNLTENEAEQAMDIIMDGSAAQAQIGSFLTALRMKGETVEEITGFVKTMRKKAECIYPKVDFSVDTCGTGGDCAHTINISTGAAFVVSAAGIPVAKHGNRSVSSKCGSADVLEELGIIIDLQPAEVEKCIEEIGIGFMFAPNFHKSMKNVGGARKELGIRTVFNILGPLTNPANASGQLIGVFKKELADTMAEVLLRLGTQRAMIVHGSDGLDEITVSGSTFITQINEGEIINYTLTPDDFGIKKSSVEELRGGEKAENALIIKEILNGRKKGAARDAIILNSAAALYIGNKAKDIYEGVILANDIIDSGKAARKLEEFVEYTRRVEL